jgi:hypothetical protein
MGGLAPGASGGLEPPGRRAVGPAFAARGFACDVPSLGERADAGLAPRGDAGPDERTRGDAGGRDPLVPRGDAGGEALIGTAGVCEKNPVGPIFLRSPHLRVGRPPPDTPGPRTEHLAKLFLWSLCLVVGAMALPIHHDTKPPPTAESFAPAVDRSARSLHCHTCCCFQKLTFDVRHRARSKPWTKEDDEVLRKLVVEFQKTDKFPPWGLIASRAKFGHNSGSCEKRCAREDNPYTAQTALTDPHLCRAGGERLSTTKTCGRRATGFGSRGSPRGVPSMRSGGSITARWTRAAPTLTWPKRCRHPCEREHGAA